MRAGPRREVRKFGSDVAAANQDDARGSPIKLKKYFAGDGVLLAGDIQRYWARAGSDQDVSSLELPAIDDDHISTCEAGNSVKGVDAVFGEILFQTAGDRIGEVTLKDHQLMPIDPGLACDAMPAHTHLRVDRLCTAHQHSLRIAATKGAGPTERTMIDQCYGPPGGTHSG